MFKRLFSALLLLLIITAAFIGLRFFTSDTAFDSPVKYLYIHTGQANYDQVLQTIRDSQFVKHPGSFDVLAKRLSVPEKIKPGRYEIKKGMSLLAIARILRNGQQSPVHFTIKKIRTKEDLAGMVGRKFECDSTAMMHFLNNPDTLKTYGLDTNTVITAIYPDTYTYFWNTTPTVIFHKFYAAYEKVWTEERKQKAQQHGLTPAQAYTLASIVEEETNAQEEKGNVASVYLNRYKKGMRLQADPTVKFALRNFALKRIYEKYLAVESPYNTYRVTGLPPGPICTPSLETLDAVLDSPSTNYLYFVAKSDFSGRHTFSETYAQHLVNAKAFQKALDEQQRLRAAANDSPDTK